MELNELFRDESLESVEAKIDMEKYLATLSKREAEILTLWAFGYTQAEIGAKYGLSQRHIGRVLAKMSKSAQKSAVVSEGNDDDETMCMRKGNNEPI